MHLTLVSNPNAEKKIALESTRIGRGRGGDGHGEGARGREFYVVEFPSGVRFH